MFFHLFQSFLSKIQEHLKVYLSDSEFRLSYRLMQALAYLPEKDVVEGLNYIKKTMNKNFKRMIDYLKY